MQRYKRLLQFFLALREAAPVQRLLVYRNHIARFLYVVWIIGCGYWIYQLMIIEVRPQTNPLIICTDPKEALFYIFFGTIGAVFVFLFLFYVFKFFYNIFHDAVYALFPTQCYSMARAASYLVVLCMAFSFTGHIKTIGLIAYNQTVEIVRTARQHDEISEEHIAELQDLMKSLDAQKPREDN